MKEILYKTSQMSSPFLKFHGTLTSVFPPYILLVLWSNMIFFLHAIYCLFSTSSLPTTICKSTYVEETTTVCCFQSSNFIFGSLSVIAMFLGLKRKAVNIQALWVVAALDICRMCTLFTNVHMYLSAGSAASHSVLALLETSSPPQKGMGHIY